MNGRNSAGAVIGGLLLGRPFNFTLLPFNHRQRKISGDKSERLLTEKRYSPYRPVAAGREKWKRPFPIFYRPR
jgi:hypothetical protein